MIRIDEYQIERLDKYNLKVSKEVINKNNKSKLQLIGYYPAIKQAVLSIIKHKTEDNLDYTSLDGFIKKYDTVSKYILNRLSEIL